MDPAVDGPPGLRTASTLDERVSSETGILIQAPDGAGGWRTVRHYYPRSEFDEFNVDSLAAGIMRLVFVARHKVRNLGRIDYLVDVSGPVTVSPTRAVHSRAGSVAEELAANDGAIVTIEPGDSLTLEFDAFAPTEGMVREWFLLAHGSYASSPTPTSEGFPTLSSAPSLTLELGAARPNPSSGDVMIPFTLPTDEQVTIRIYDVAGRLVRTLVNRGMSAGKHEAVWDARSDGGIRVGRGVYFYRMQSRDWTSQKKVVLLDR